MPKSVEEAEKAMKIASVCRSFGIRPHMNVIVFPVEGEVFSSRKSLRIRARWGRCEFLDERSSIVELCTSCTASVCPCNQLKHVLEENGEELMYDESVSYLGAAESRFVEREKFVVMLEHLVNVIYFL